MPRFLRCFVLPALLLACGGLAAPGAAAEDTPPVPGMPEKTGKKIENPMYAAWAKFKVGAWVRHVSTSEAAGQASKQTITQKLVELTETKAVVEMTMTMEVAGQKIDVPAQRHEHEKLMDEYKPVPMPDGDKPKVTEGEEKLTVGDKTIACKTIESSGKANGGTYWSKIWSSTEVPGGQAQMETRSEMGGMKVSTKSVLDGFGEK